VGKRVAVGGAGSPLLEFRYEFWESWPNMYDTIPDDTSLDLGIYFDVDQNGFTGRSDFNGIPLNGIGAEYRVIIGIHGLEALASWDDQNSKWDVIYDPYGFVYLILPPDTNYLEYGILWTDIGNPLAADIISINAFFFIQDDFFADWMPDQDNGHITVWHEDRYIGEVFKRINIRRMQQRQSTTRVNPYGGT
jgi:hypothetical protein